MENLTIFGRLYGYSRKDSKRKANELWKSLGLAMRQAAYCQSFPAAPRLEGRPKKIAHAVRRFFRRRAIKVLVGIILAVAVVNAGIAIAVAASSKHEASAWPGSSFTFWPERNWQQVERRIEGLPASSRLEVRTIGEVHYRQGSFPVTLLRFPALAGAGTAALNRKGLGSGYFAPSVCEPAYLSRDRTGRESGRPSSGPRHDGLKRPFRDSDFRFVHRLRGIFTPEVMGLVVAMVGVSVIPWRCGISWALPSRIPRSIPALWRSP